MMDFVGSYQTYWQLNHLEFHKLPNLNMLTVIVSSISILISNLYSLVRNSLFPDSF